MPKEISTKSYRLHNFVIEFGESVFSTDNFILVCKICNVNVTSEKHFSIIQNLTHQKITHIENKKTNNLQQLVANCNPKLLKFNSDLCKTFLSANICTTL
jgi:hypothetical protein